MKSAGQYLTLFKGAVCLMAAVQTACFSIFDYLPSPPYGYSGLVNGQPSLSIKLESAFRITLLYRLTYEIIHMNCCFLKGLHVSHAISSPFKNLKLFSIN